MGLEGCGLLLHPCKPASGGTRLQRLCRGMCGGRAGSWRLSGCGRNEAGSWMQRGTPQLVVRRGICRRRDTHTIWLSPECPRTPWGLPCMFHLVLASPGSSSGIGAMNSGSPLTPDPSSQIACEEEPCPSRRAEQEGTFSQRAAEASRRRRRRGSLAVQRQYFAVHSKRASSCLWIWSVLLIVSKSCCSRWLPPSSCWMCCALVALRV